MVSSRGQAGGAAPRAWLPAGRSAPPAPRPPLSRRPAPRDRSAPRRARRYAVAGLRPSPEPGDVVLHEPELLGDRSRWVGGGHQVRGVETPAFRPERKRRFTSPEMSVPDGIFKLPATAKRAHAGPSTKPRQGMPWLRGEATGLPGLRTANLQRDHGSRLESSSFRTMEDVKSGCFLPLAPQGEGGPGPLRRWSG